MKKLAIGTLAVALLFSITALAGENGKAVTVKGWVSDTECAAHGDKKTGLGDRGRKQDLDRRESRQARRPPGTLRPSKRSCQRRGRNDQG